MYFQGFVIPVMAENKHAYLYMAKPLAIFGGFTPILDTGHTKGGS